MARIAIFDSGVGGLSIYKEIKHKLPNSQYVFVSDNKAFPYGTKPEDELTERVLEVVARIIDQFDPDLLVIGCNTASTVVLPVLREKFDLPVVGVVPAIKPAAELTQTNVIGLLATPATIEREYTEQLINDFAPNCEVIKVGSSRLVEIAEDKLYGKEVNQEQIKVEIQRLLESDKIDVLILACTHFPLLNEELVSLFNETSDIDLVDSGKGIANRVAQLVSEINIKDAQHNPCVAVFIELENLNPNFKQKLTSLEFAAIELLN